MVVMECTHPLMQVTEKQLQAIREACNVDDKRLNEDIAAVLEWTTKEPHLQDASSYLAKTRIIERLLTLTNSIEETKKRTDKLLTSRGLMSEIVLNMTMDELQSTQGWLSYINMPTLNPKDLSRVIVVKFKSEHLDEFSILKYFRCAFLMGESKLYDDLCVSETHIIDLKNVNIGMLAKVNPVILKKAEVLATEGHGNKIKGIHLLNAPSFVDKFMFILKQVLKPKVAGRLHVHQSYEDLHKYVPKEVLPKDYGGDAASCEKLTEQWNEWLGSEDGLGKLRGLDKIVSNESKRSKAKFNEEYLGMPGSFRKLEMD